MLGGVLGTSWDLSRFWLEDTMSKFLCEERQKRKTSTTQCLTHVWKLGIEYAYQALGEEWEGSCSERLLDGHRLTAGYKQVVLVFYWTVG